MKDYRLRIGMRFAQQGREFVIEGPLPGDQLKIKDTFTDVCSVRTTADLLEDLTHGNQKHKNGPFDRVHKVWAFENELVDS